MLHYYWDMVRDEFNYFSFRALFCPFTPLTAQKIKIKKKYQKNHLEISSFYISVPKIMIRWCTVSEIWCKKTAQKTKILKKWKKIFETSPFYICVLKIMIRWCTVPEICCTMDGGTDRWMDRQIEKVTYRGGSPT